LEAIDLMKWSSFCWTCCMALSSAVDERHTLCRPRAISSTNSLFMFTHWCFDLFLTWVLTRVLNIYRVYCVICQFLKFFSQSSVATHTCGKTCCIRFVRNFILFANQLRSDSFVSKFPSVMFESGCISIVMEKVVYISWFGSFAEFSHFPDFNKKLWQHLVTKFRITLDRVTINLLKMIQISIYLDEFVFLYISILWCDVWHKLSLRMHLSYLTAANLRIFS